MISRRHLVAGVALAPATRVAAAAAQDETPMQLEPVPFSAATPAPIEDLAELEIYDGDPEALWAEPWHIGTKAIDIGGAIVQRFTAPEGQGFALGHDGVMARSVIYAKHGFQRYFYLAVDSDLSELEDAKTVATIATYGGVQHTPSSGWDEPILIAHEIIAPE